MAELSADKTYVTVKPGDTLSAIARDYGNGKTYLQLAEINGIKNPDHITIGQKIYLKRGGSSSSSSTTTDPYTPVVTTLGRQTSDVNTLLAVWTFGKESETEKYETWWEYDLGDGVWYVDKGSVDTDVKAVKHATWAIKENTRVVKFKVKAIPKKKSDGKTLYFDGDWSAVKKWTNTDPLSTPTGLTIKIEGHTLTAELPSIVKETNTPPTHVCFQIVQNDTKVFNTIYATIKYVEKDSALQPVGTASASCDVTPGSKYKVRCYVYYKSGNTTYYSDWSSPTENTPAVPAKVSKIIDLIATRDVNNYGIHVKWAESKTAESYEIQYLTKKEDFDVATSIPSTTVEDQLECKIDGLESGKEYFVRVRAKNATGDSDWSEIKSVVLGTKPIEPTTWSSTTTIIEDEDLMLYWVHNSADGSSQTEAQLELSMIIDGVTTTKTFTVKNLTGEEDKDKTRFCTVHTSNATISWTEDSGEIRANLGVTFDEGAKIDWRVRTKGIHADYGEFSTQRTVDVYARPNLNLSIGAATYYLVEQSVGNDSIVYTKTPELIDVVSGEAILGTFTKDNERVYNGMTNDGTTVYYCPETVDGETRYYRVEVTTATGVVVYTKTGTEVDIISGDAIVGAYTTDNNQVYTGLTRNGDTVYYCFEVTELVVDDSEVSDLPVITEFPFYLEAVPGPATQIPLSYHVSITANSSYETVDSVGNFKMVSAGEQVYSKHFDIKHDLMVEFTPGNIDLENGVEYTATCTVSMNSGLTSEASVKFTVGWVDMKNVPNAEVGIDPDALTASIQPYCREHHIEYRKVDRVGRNYVVSDTVYDFGCGEPVRNAVTTTGEQVYLGGTILGEETYENVYYCEVETMTPVNDVYLSVYRREFDGSFTELAKMLDGAKNTTITDPHPALDFARYRIVAISKMTGAVSYYDLPAIPVNGRAVVIQWDEAWSSFDATVDATLAEPEWAGSMLKLPYNIDVSDSNDPEVELIEYVGRQHPVSYYGTHKGQKSSWNVVVEKDDEETLYGLRRLAMWMGDVYVREPSGSGYWANIKVSFNQKHSDLTIPVALDITRVEGGV